MSKAWPNFLLKKDRHLMHNHHTSTLPNHTQNSPNHGAIETFLTGPSHNKRIHRTTSNSTLNPLLPNPHKTPPLPPSQRPKNPHRDDRARSLRREHSSRRNRSTHTLIIRRPTGRSSRRERRVRGGAHGSKQEGDCAGGASGQEE